MSTTECAPLGIPADPNCIAEGVTTAIDAGSAGAHTFPGLRKYVINTSDTRILALLNISVVGQSTLSQDNPWGELLDLRYANAALATRTIERHRDVIVGMKVRLTRNIAGEHDLEVLRRAREAAEAAGVPVMVPIGGSHSSVPEILALTRPGDVITHSFRGGEGGILDAQGRVYDEVLERVARESISTSTRGGKLFLRHSGKSNGARTKARHDFQRCSSIQRSWASVRSSHDRFQVPVLGLSLEEAIQRVTSNPSQVFGRLNQLGTLREGAEADIAVFAIDEGRFRLTDALGETRMGRRMLRPVATVKAGELYGAATIPTERL